MAFMPHFSSSRGRVQPYQFVIIFCFGRVPGHFRNEEAAMLFEAFGLGARRHVLDCTAQTMFYREKQAALFECLT